MNTSVKRALLIHGFSFSKSPCGYKKVGKRLLSEAPKCSDHGFSLVFLLSPSWDLCCSFQQNMLEENLRVIREVSAASSCVPNALVGSMLNIMSLHLPMRQFWGRWVESYCVTSLGLPVSRCPRTDISGGEAWSCHKVFREKEKFLCKMLQEDLQGDYCNLPPCSWNFSPRNFSARCYQGITSLFFVTASGRSSCSMFLRKPRSVRAEPSRFVKLCNKKYSSCNVE